MNKKIDFIFDKNFLWGASNGAYQVEGGNYNQWSVWEQENAMVLSAQSKGQYGDLKSWDSIKCLAKLPANYVSGRAIDHYNNYEKDFKYIDKMGLKCFKFGIEWSRVEPDKGAWSVEALSYYKEYIKKLKSMGVEPILTLFHNTTPVWFEEMGGFQKKKNVEYFLHFVEKISSELKSNIKYFITLHEPTVYAEKSFLDGDWPPQKTSKVIYRNVLNNLAYAHKKATKIIKNNQTRAKVSVTHYADFPYAGDETKLSKRSTKFLSWMKNEYFLRKIYRSCDFLGVNFYESSRVIGYRVHNPETKVSDNGKNIRPEDLEIVIKNLYKKYKLPIFVTGSGLADFKDSERKKWLTSNIISLNNCIKDGVDVIGYIHSDMFDSFVWTYGRWAKYGLVAIDYKTMKRKVRPSGLLYKKIISNLS